MGVAIDIDNNIIMRKEEIPSMARSKPVICPVSHTMLSSSDEKHELQNFLHSQGSPQLRLHFLKGANGLRQMKYVAKLQSMVRHWNDLLLHVVATIFLKRQLCLPSLSCILSTGLAGSEFTIYV